MHIDQLDGTVSLPNGFSISPGLSQDAFRAGPAFTNARSRDYGTLPWIHYHFFDGQVDGKDLLASLCFYDQLLVWVSLSADLYPPGPKAWLTYSLEVEAATKQFHDRLLERMFGKPSERGRVFLPRAPEDDRALQQWLCWRFPWGRVWSSHDFKGGGTDITVTYGNRRDAAGKAYRLQEAGAARTRRIDKQKIEASVPDQKSGSPDRAHTLDA